MSGFFVFNVGPSLSRWFIFSELAFQVVSSLVWGFISRDCLCLFLALSCQDVSSLGRGVLVSCLSVFNVGPMLSRCVVFRQLTCQDVSSLGRGVHVSSSFVFNVGPTLSRCVVFRQGRPCLVFVWV